MNFYFSSNTLPAAPAASNEWALAPAPAPAQPNNQWAAAAQPDNGWAMAPPQPPTPVPVQQQQLQQQPAYDQYGGGGAPGAYAANPNPFAPAAPVPMQQAPALVQNYTPPAPPDLCGFPTATGGRRMQDERERKEGGREGGAERSWPQGTPRQA